MALVVVLRLLATETRIHPRTVPVEFVVDEEAL
jgi:hypothetical protein